MPKYPDHLTPFAAVALPLLEPLYADLAPLDRANALVQLGEELEYLARFDVLEAVAAGATWQEVGDAFGITRQSAFERFKGRRVL